MDWTNIVDAPTYALLSNREIEIMGWIAHGDTNREVADRLGCRETAVVRHACAVGRKLGVGTGRRPELVARFRAAMAASTAGR